MALQPDLLYYFSKPFIELDVKSQQVFINYLKYQTKKNILTICKGQSDQDLIALKRSLQFDIDHTEKLISLNSILKEYLNKLNVTAEKAPLSSGLSCTNANVQESRSNDLKNIQFNVPVTQSAILFKFMEEFMNLSLLNEEEKFIFELISKKALAGFYRRNLGSKRGAPEEQREINLQMFEAERDDQLKDTYLNEQGKAIIRNGQEKMTAHFRCLQQLSAFQRLMSSSVSQVLKEGEIISADHFLPFTIELLPKDPAFLKKFLAFMEKNIDQIDAYSANFQYNLTNLQASIISSLQQIKQPQIETPYNREALVQIHLASQRAAEKEKAFLQLGQLRYELYFASQDAHFFKQPKLLINKLNPLARTLNSKFYSPFVIIKNFTTQFNSFFPSLAQNGSQKSARQSHPLEKFLKDQVAAICQGQQFCQFALSRFPFIVKPTPAKIKISLSFLRYPLILNQSINNDNLANNSQHTSAELVDNESNNQDSDDKIIRVKLESRQQNYEGTSELRFIKDFFHSYPSSKIFSKNSFFFKEKLIPFAYRFSFPCKLKSKSNGFKLEKIDIQREDQREEKNKKK